MKLTSRILDAIISMSAHVEAGTVEDYGAYDNAETRKEYADAIDAGIWAREQHRKRKAKREAAAAIREPKP